MKKIVQPEIIGNWQPPTKILNAMFIGVFIANISLHIGQDMSNTLLSLYVKSLGASGSQIGIISSLFAYTALVFRFVSGPAMNSFNRKKLVCMAMSFMTTAYLGFSFAPTLGPAIGVSPITIIKVFRLIQGIGNAFGNACLLTIAADSLPPEKFASGMGYYACAQLIAKAITPTIAVFFRDWLGYSTTYLVIAAIMICAIFVTSRVVKLAPRKRLKFEIKPSTMIAKEALIPASIQLFLSAGFTSINSFFLVYTEERGISGASLFFTVYSFSMLATRPFVGKFVDKYGVVKVGIPAILITCCSFVVIGYANSLPLLLVAAFVNACGYGSMGPAFQSLSMQSVPPERRGSASATTSISTDLATIIGPMICGVVADALGYVPLMWVAMTVPLFCGMGLLFALRNRIHKIESDFLARSAAEAAKNTGSSRA